jgi:hypothetical protein
MKHVALRAVLVGLLLAGCGNNDATPTTPTTGTGPTTETFSSNLTVQGSAWRLVTASQAGTLSARLTTASQPSTVVGFGIGIQNGTTTGCLLNSEVRVTAGSTPQVDAPVDPGVYCIKISDVGTLTSPMGFTITIVRP